MSRSIRHSTLNMHSSAFGLSLATILLALSCTPTPKEKKWAEPSHRPTDIPAQVKGVDHVSADIEYTVDFGDATHHYISIRAVYPTAANADVELSMAVWTPGSYLVREYARQIEDLRVVDATGVPLTVSKGRKNRWKIHTGATPGIVVEYKLYCRELSVRTNFVDADSAVLNGAPTFLTLADDNLRPHIVRLQLPEGFHDAVSALESDTPNVFRAANYDELVDSPIIAGREMEIGEFAINKIPHRLVHLGDSSQWDLQEALTDVEQLTRAEMRFWGVVPYEHYDFLNVILGVGGGLEHLDSTLMMSKALGTQKGKDYRGWLGLVSHEFFHTWNIKRLRPSALGPFDYENENHTRSLWIAEGITSYYDDLLMRRAGLLDEEQYLERLSGQILSLQSTPGRLVQPLSRASYDAWIKHYRRDENSQNTSVSYYTKGAVVAFLLDVEIRKGSEGTKSLDDLMRAMYDKYSGEQGYTPEDFRSMASEFANQDLTGFFVAALDSTDELDYTNAINYFGLALSQPNDQPKETPEDKEIEEEEDSGWLGVTTKNSVVKSTKRGTPGYEAGINVGDEILAIDNYRAIDLASLLEKFAPGQKVSITLSRRGKLRTISATLGTEADTSWVLSVLETPTAAQASRYRDWVAEYQGL